MGGIPEPDNCIGLRTLLALDDVEFHVIALFQSFVPIQLNCRVVDEYVWPVFTPDESVAFGVVEPLDLSFVLSHWLPPSLHVRSDGEQLVSQRSREHGESLAVNGYDEERSRKVDYLY
jgi:hypothetical protein